ncbi:hypothetical protein ACFWWC_47700 [Streptomyces sp. NPDC058642]|uniref:hypothetical protein n=1 Tax=Streptomyces sp. NPDC058642 TaxID=3346572 RepID=UPI0036541F06
MPWCRTASATRIARPRLPQYKHDIYPDWIPPQHGTDCPGLTWDISEQQPGAAQIGSLLTASAIVIPAAVFHQRSAHDGLLELGDGPIRLSSGPVWDRVTQRTRN